jgi:hypothetical protein
MDPLVQKTIEHLKTRLAVIESAIGVLEARNVQPTPRSRRGRKSMGAEERQTVSERLKRYWADRRAAKV